MTSPCRGCKKSGRVGSNELAARAQMEAAGPLKALEEMTDAEIVEQCATWMALKNGGPKEQVLQTLGGLPVAHVRTMLEQLRGGA
jgi:hypothetical protein